MGDNPFEEPSSTHNQRLLNTGGSRSYGGSGGYQPKEVFGDAYVDAEGSTETFKPELQFQTFQHSSQPPSRGTISSSGGSGAGSSGGGGGRGVSSGGAIIQPDQSTVVDFEDDRTGKQPLQGISGGEGNPPAGDNQPPPDPPIETSSSKFWTIQFYRPLFNVDTAQVLQRIFRSLTPFRFGFIETARTNPDFYGPFWIATTLIFVLAIFGNLSKVIDEAWNNKNSTPTPAPTSSPAPTSAPSNSDENDLLPNFFMIVVGSCVFYGYTVVVPLVLWGVFKYLSVPVKLLEIICIYGYSLFIFIPVSLLCVIPMGVLQWVLTIFAAGWSGFFLVSNLFVTVKDIAFKRGAVIMLIVGGLHVALGFVYKLYFFKYALNK